MRGLRGEPESGSGPPPGWKRHIVADKLEVYFIPPNSTQHLKNIYEVEGYFKHMKKAGSKNAGACFNPFEFDFSIKQPQPKNSEKSKAIPGVASKPADVKSTVGARKRSEPASNEPKVKAVANKSPAKAVTNKEPSKTKKPKLDSKNEKKDQTKALVKPSKTVEAVKPPAAAAAPGEKEHKDEEKHAANFKLSPSKRKTRNSLSTEFALPQIIETLAAGSPKTPPKAAVQSRRGRPAKNPVEPVKTEAVVDSKVSKSAAEKKEMPAPRPRGRPKGAVARPVASVTVTANKSTKGAVKKAAALKVPKAKTPAVSNPVTVKATERVKRKYVKKADVAKAMESAATTAKTEPIAVKAKPRTTSSRRGQGSGEILMEMEVNDDALMDVVSSQSLMSALLPDYHAAGSASRPQQIDLSTLSPNARRAFRNLEPVRSSGTSSGVGTSGVRGSKYPISPTRSTLAGGSAVPPSYSSVRIRGAQMYSTAPTMYASTQPGANAEESQRYTQLPPVVLNDHCYGKPVPDKENGPDSEPDGVASEVQISALPVPTSPSTFLLKSSRRTRSPASALSAIYSAAALADHLESSHLPQPSQAAAAAAAAALLGESFPVMDPLTSLGSSASLTTSPPGAFSGLDIPTSFPGSGVYPTSVPVMPSSGLMATEKMPANILEGDESDMTDPQSEFP